jgi:uncharacterized membrane protein YphA (DoxX/SURF4 family)
MAFAGSWRDWVGLLARLVLGAVLVVAGALKVGHLETSARAVRAYQLFSYDVAGWIGYGLPVLELAIGALLVLGLFTRTAAVVGGTLMVVFIAGIASAWARGLSIDCGCFGEGGTIDPSQTAYLPEILRDVGLLACATWLVIRPRTALGLDGWLFPGHRDKPALAHDDTDRAHEGHYA